MISDERLEEIIYRAEMFGHGAGYTPNEIIPMARELLALRKAFSEPVVWAHIDELDKAMKVNGDGMMCGFGCVTKDWTAPNTILLYRKPTDSTT